MTDASARYHHFGTSLLDFFIGYLSESHDNVDECPSPILWTTLRIRSSQKAYNLVIFDNISIREHIQWWNENRTLLIGERKDETFFLWLITHINYGGEIFLTEFEYNKFDR